MKHKVLSPVISGWMMFWWLITPGLGVAATNETVVPPPASVSTTADATLTNQTAQGPGLAEWQAEQEQTRDAIREARAAIEQAQQQTRNLETRIGEFEQSLTRQYETERAALKESHRFSFALLAVVAGLGFVGLVVVAVVLMRSMSRRIDQVVQIGSAGALPALGDGSALAAAGANETSRSSARFLGSMERLEQRIAEMEQQSENAAVSTTTGSRPDLELVPLPARDEKTESCALWLGKGRSLFNLGQYEEALGCFDRALAADETHAEAYVKKGKTLEKLDRLDEAAAQYERAIETDPTLTIAYLYKGALLNRQEQFAEALACYEQALQVQERSRVAHINA